MNNSVRMTVRPPLQADSPKDGLQPGRSERDGQRHLLRAARQRPLTITAALLSTLTHRLLSVRILAWCRCWQSINHRLGTLDREDSGREASPSAAVIDARSVKTTTPGGSQVAIRTGNPGRAGAALWWIPTAAHRRCRSMLSTCGTEVVPYPCSSSPGGACLPLSYLRRYSLRSRTRLDRHWHRHSSRPQDPKSSSLRGAPTMTAGRTPLLPSQSCPQTGEQIRGHHRSRSRLIYIA